MPSSDETPAQKPSSISVPPGDAASIPQRPRGKRLWALAAVVIGGVFLAQRFILSERIQERQVAARAESDDAVERLSRASLESKPSLTVPPATSLPSSIGPKASVEPLGASNAVQKPTDSEVVSRAPVPSSPSAATPAIPSAPVPVRPRIQPQSSQRPALPQRGAAGRAPAIPDLTLGSDEPSWASAPSPEATPKDAPSPGRAESAPSNSPAGAEPTKAALTPEGAQPAASSASGVTSSSPATLRAFASEQAKQQLAVAASESSRCASLGSTRGAGKVNVSIATWGRVVRVTHLNQAFVGTPVGVCVMEAFQKVQVPPFDGAMQTLSGSFLIQ